MQSAGGEKGKKKSNEEMGSFVCWIVNGERRRIIKKGGDKNMETLLEKAKKMRSGRRIDTMFNDECFELVMAWVNNEISLSQLGRVLGTSEHPKAWGNVAYVSICHCFKQMYKEGLLIYKPRNAKK